jgi:hypothetical protein
MPNEIFTQEQEQMIREAFEADDAELGINKLNQVRALESVFKRVDQSSSEISKNKVLEKSFGWKALSASVVSAFSLGAIVANFVMIPSMTIGTRSVFSESPSEPIFAAHDQFKVLNLHGADKHLFVKEVLSAASRSDLLVKVQQRDERLLLSVGDFRPMSKNQEKVRELLQLESSFRGQIEVEIR